MTEENSQTTPAPAEPRPSEENSQTVAPVTQPQPTAPAEAPGDNASTLPTHPSESAPPPADSAQAEGATVEGVTQKEESSPEPSHETISDYQQRKQRLLSGEPEAKAPDPAPNPPPSSEEPPAKPDESQNDPPASKPSRIHFRPQSDEDAAFMQAYKQARDADPNLELKTFALQQLVPPKSAEDRSETSSSEPAPQSSEDTPPVTFDNVGDLDAKVARLNDLKWEELENYNPRKAKEYESQMEELLKLRPRLEQTLTRVESIKKQEAMAAASQAWESGLSKAQTLFPEAGVEGSALETQAVQVRNRWLAENHPLANDPGSAVALYAEAAAELGQSPSSFHRPAAPSAAPPRVTPSTVHRPPTSIIAGGDAARSVPPPQPALDPSLSPAEKYHAKKAALFSQRPARVA